MSAVEPTLDAPTPYGWDWSSTTHDCRDDEHVTETVRGALRALGGFHALPGKGKQGWSRSFESFDVDGYKLGTVFFGGGRQDVHVESTSSAADVSRVRVLEAVPGKTSRVDTRVDTLVKFEDLAGILEAAGEMYGSEVVTYARRQGPRGHREDTGRTVYLGAPSSAIRVRLYEKWLESPGEYSEGTNRVEVQLRPPSKTKARVSGWDRAQTFCASRVTRDLAQRLGADLAPAASLHVARSTPDLEQSLAAMGKQYGRAAARWLEVSGGDLNRLLEYLTVDA